MLPEYTLVEEKGAAHNKTFYIQVSYNGEILAVADGKTKKQAEQQAAFIACKKIGIIKENTDE